MPSVPSTADGLNVSVSGSGATKLVTTDHTGATAHFEIEADGDITLG